MRLNPKVVVAFVGGASLCFTAMLISRPIDLNEKDMLPRYEGPGYRMAFDGGGEGGVAGGPPPIGFPASNVTLLSWLPLNEFSGGSQNGNDCWGYTAPSGREYAIMGTYDGTGFVEVTTPTNAVLVDFINGPDGLWRDIKTYQNYAYAVSESGGGIQVFDLSDIDNGQVTNLGTVGSGDSHNVAIDTESGFLYRIGGPGPGLTIYSLANPASPVQVGAWSDRYIHDAQIVTYTSGPYAGKQVAFCCSGGSGEPGLDILDVTDKNNIIEMGRVFYSQPGYSHQAWLSEDRQYLYLNDEADETNYGIPSTTRVIDVADLNDASEVATFTSGSPAIDHNLYTHNGLIYEANYRSGLRIFDYSNPTNPQEIAYFDTYPENDNPSFNGMWSVYPYFESGTIVCSDLEKGLFVFFVGDPPLQLQFPDGLPDLLNPNGQILRVDIIVAKGETLDPSSAKLFYDDGAGYESTDMVLQEDLTYLATFPATECAVEVNYYVEARTVDGFLVRSPTGAPGNAYTVLSAVGQSIDYQDSMESDLGWSVSGDAVDGQWDRGVPVGGGDRGDPATDADGSGQCFLTDNEDGNSDVDDGTTILTSYALDGVVKDGIAFVAYQRWYSNNFGGSPNQDSMPVEISNNNGASWVQLELVTENAGAWVDKAFRIDQFVTPTDQIRLRFSPSDLGDGSVVEAGVDDLRIIVVECTSGVPGDLDGDGAVGAADLAILLGAWGPCPPKGECPADLDGDGVVGAADLAILLGSWG